MKKYSYVIVCILLVLFIVQATYYVRYKSPAHDESNWMTIAWYLTHMWTWQGDYHVLMHPPLSFYMHGIPLKILEWWYQDSSKTPPQGALATQFPYPYSEVLKYDTVFTIAKLSMLPFALVLGWYIYRWAVRLYGVYAGLFALTLYVFNPYIIAHATIISTDMTIVCFTFFATYYFWKFCEHPSYRRLVVAGITLGFALLSRYSGVLLFPIFCILEFLLWLYNRSQPEIHRPFHPAKILVIGLIVIICIALFILEAGYLFDMQPLRSFRSEQRSDIMYRIFQEIPIPFGAYINGIRLHQSFLFWMVRKYFFAGQTWTSPPWYYNVYALLLRNPVSMTIFFLVSVLSWIGTSRKFVLDEMFLVVPALFIFSYFSFFFPVYGLRFILPIYPFLFVFMSRVITWNILKKTSVRIIFITLIVWYVLSDASAFPHYFAYCNELIGGMENGRQWFDIDSGQDLKGLGQYMQQAQIPFVKLAYSGKGIPEYYGVRYVPLSESEECQPTNGVIAISVSKLRGTKEHDAGCYDWLKVYEPVDKIGYSIFIYHIP